MEMIYSLLFLGEVTLILFGDTILGLKCPICGSRKHWETPVWGQSKNYKEAFCTNCCKAMYHAKVHKMITFDYAQNI